jgi:F-type H+-transporting ATPase subunit b
MNINLTLVAQFLWFFAFVWFTARFVWPPLMRAVEDRQKKIADGLAAAEKGQQELVSANGRVEELVRGAKAQSQELIANAQKRADEMVEQAKTAAKTEGERQIAAARASIEQEIQQAREQLRGQVAQLAMTGAEQILMREIDPAKHKDVLDKLSARL